MHAENEINLKKEPKEELNQKLQRSMQEKID